MSWSKQQWINVSYVTTSKIIKIRSCYNRKNLFSSLGDNWFEGEKFKLMLMFLTFGSQICRWEYEISKVIMATFGPNWSFQLS